MRRFHIVGLGLLLLLLVGVAVAGCDPNYGGGGPNLVYIANDDDLASAVTIGLVAERFGLDVDTVILVDEQGGFSDDDLIGFFTLCSLAHFTDYDYLIGLRHRGLGWIDCARELGIPDRHWDSYRQKEWGRGWRKHEWRNDNDFRRGVYSNFMSDRFGVSAADLRQRSEAGYSSRDLTAALAMGKQTRQPWDQMLVSHGQTNKPWVDMARDRQLDMSQLNSLYGRRKASHKMIVQRGDEARSRNKSFYDKEQKSRDDAIKRGKLDGKYEREGGRKGHRESKQ